MIDIQGIEASKAKSGTLVLVFGKIVWRADDVLIAALQKEKIVGAFEYTPRALNTKVLVFPWIVPATVDIAAAQRDALAKHADLKEAHGLAMPELSNHYIDDDEKVVPYMDGGELTVAMARAAPAQLASVMTYLRNPQRQDWFMDALAAVAADTKKPGDRALIYDAIAEMPIPPTSNKHHKTYVRCVNEGAAAFRAAKDISNAERLEKKAAMFAKKKK